MSHTLHLPAIHNNAPVTGTALPMSPNAMSFTVAWLAAMPDNRRTQMVLDDRLVTAAQLHAAYLDSRTEQEIAERANVSHASHYGRDWSTANERVRAQNYQLPSNYPLQGNHVESNARIGDGALAALEALLNSDAHRPHLLGEPGFEDRTVYGICNCEADWVVVICPPEEAT